MSNKSLTEKILDHQRAYETIGVNPIPVYRVSMIEWREEFYRLQKSGMVPVGSSILDISEFYGQPIELVIPFFGVSER